MFKLSARLFLLLVIFMLPPIVSAQEASPTPVTYVIQRGDTLGNIASRYGLTVGALMRANNLANPELIYAGQRLIIPQASATPAPQITPTPTEQFAVPGVPYSHGIEVFFPDGDIAPLIDHVTALSMDWVRVNVYWRDLERREGEINVTRLNDVVEALDAAGINILFTVSTSPDWASPDTNSPPDDFTLYSTFVGALADHYVGVVDAYEIWSEPNKRDKWNNPAHPFTPASYADLLRQTFNQIKAFDPAASVISAGLAPISDSSDMALNDRDYLRGMYAAGLQAVSDAVGARPFGFGNDPDVPCCGSAAPTQADNAAYYFLATLSDIRAIMTENGDDAQVWITGFGWGSSQDTDAPSEEEIYVSYNTLEEQSVYTARAFELGAQFGFVGPMILSNLNGCAVDHDCYYSLLSPSGEPRPVYTVVRILFTPAQ